MKIKFVTTMISEPISISYKTLAFYLKNSLENVDIHDFKKELSAFDNLNQYGEIIVIGGLVASSIIGSYYKSALYFYVYDKIKKKEITIIDILILVNAIIQHFATLILTITYSIGLIFDLTFSDHMDRAWCNIPWYAGIYAGAYRAIGSLGIAILRLVFIKSHRLVSTYGKFGLTTTILIPSLIVSAGLSVGFGMGTGPASRKQVTWNWCLGTSERMREIEQSYAQLIGTEDAESDVISLICLIIAILTIMVEFSCYLVFFLHLYSHDQSMLDKKILSSVEVKRRCQRNAMTFLGQFYAFVVETVIYFSMMYTLIKTDSSIYARLAVSVGNWIEFGLVSVVEVMTSQSLKKYLPHNR